MQLIAPDVLEPILGLSRAGCIVGIILGALLWLTGWTAHRFWIVLAATVIAGVFGLTSGRAIGVTPIVTGVLLAVSAGMMALAVARLVAFVAAGLVVCLLVQAILPAWDDRFLIFVGGGLMGILLYRWWMMGLTSLAGTLVLAYSLICLLDQLGKIDALSWVEQRCLFLNWSCAGLTLTGVVLQMLVDRMQRQFQKKREEQRRLHHAKLELEKRLHEQPTWVKWSDQRRAA